MEISAVDTRIRAMLERSENVVSDELISRVKIVNGNTETKILFFDKAADTAFHTDCSLPEDRKLPAGEDFLVQAIGFRLPSDVLAADAHILLESGQLVFCPKAGGGIKRHWTLKSLGCGGGAQGFYTEAAASDVELVTNGSPQKNSMFVLQIPELIEAQTLFDCYAVWTAASNPSVDSIVELVFQGLHAYNVESVSK